MQPIEKIVVLGAGAMGAFYAARFAATVGFKVQLLADPARAALLKEHGLRINHQTLKLPVNDGSRHQSAADLVIVALKHHHLATGLPLLRKLVGPQTLFLSVLNGLDSEALIAAEFGAVRVLLCVAVGIDAVRTAEGIQVAHAGKLYFGESRNQPASPMVVKIQQALDRAGLAWETPADMQRILWWKFMINVGINQASAVLRAPYGVFQRCEAARAVITPLMEEVILLARRLEIDLGEADLEEWWRVLNRLAPEGKTSMLQDVEAGRPTEVEIFAGKVVALGRELGIPTPANAGILRIIRALDVMAQEKIQGGR